MVYIPPRKDGTMPKVENKKTKKSGLQKLINLGKERGHISYDELNDALPEDVSSEEMEDVLSVLEGMNIDVFDNDEEVGGQGGQEEAIIAGKESAVVDEEKIHILRESATGGNEEEDDRYDRSEGEEYVPTGSDTARIDDPVRLYLMEMGKVPLRE